METDARPDTALKWKRRGNARTHVSLSNTHTVHCKVSFCSANMKALNVNPVLSDSPAKVMDRRCGNGTNWTNWNWSGLQRWNQEKVAIKKHKWRNCPEHTFFLKTSKKKQKTCNLCNSVCFCTYIAQKWHLLLWSQYSEQHHKAYRQLNTLKNVSSIIVSLPMKS